MSVSVRVTYRNTYGVNFGGNYGFGLANSRIVISYGEFFWESDTWNDWRGYPPSDPNSMPRFCEFTEEERVSLQSRLRDIPCPFSKPKGTDATFKKGKPIDDQDLLDLEKYFFRVDASKTEYEAFVEEMRLRVISRLQATYRRALLASISENCLYVHVELQPEGTAVEKAKIKLTNDDAFLLGKHLILASQGLLESEEVVVRK